MKFKKKKTFIALIATFIILVIGVVVALNFLPAKQFIKYTLNSIWKKDVLYSVYYQNNVPYYSLSDVDFDKNDVREVQVTKDSKILINHSRGFSLSFPLDAKFDFTAAQEYITVTCDNMSAVVSKEYSTYPDKSQTKQFVDDYLHKYMLDERYIEQNKITLHKNSVEKIGDFWVQIVAL